MVFGPDGDTAYVVLRKDQRLVRIRSLKSEPMVDAYAKVGSEPTGLALSPSGDRVFVANWNDGTVSVVNAATMKAGAPIDLNPALVAGGYSARSSHARPWRTPLDRREQTAIRRRRRDHVRHGVLRQQIEAEAATARTQTFATSARLPSLARGLRGEHDRSRALEDVGFKDANGVAAGCFPNQLQPSHINGYFAYVLSVCASPKGPLGTKVTTTTCANVEDCASLSLVDPACVVPFGGAPSAVCVDVAGVKTSTEPVVSIIDTRTGEEVPDGARNLNAEFNRLYDELGLEQGQRRFPLFASDLAFVPGTGVAYASANGADAVFRLVFEAEQGTLLEVGGSTSPFIDLTPKGIATDKAGKNPIGVAAAGNPGKFAIVGNDVSRNATIVDFNTQGVAGGVKAPNVVQTAALPAAKSAEERILKGKRLFGTGTGRWSLGGQGWGACQSCHSDGLSDNVTWYFGRGPRQATSLEGSFASNDPTDQRLFNWTAIFDEVDDFESNTRDVSGGVGATVSALSTPPRPAIASTSWA